MTTPVPGDQIEALVGARRHPTFHIAKAVSAERMVYLLHSQECADALADLRLCSFSRALDRGINPGEEWREHQDRPVVAALDAFGFLVPVERLDVPPMQPTEGTR